VALVEINWQPTRRDLRVFGLGLAVFCMIIAWWCYRTFHGDFEAVETALALVAVFAVVSSIFAPGFLRPAYVVFMVVAFPVGWVVSHVLLAVVFYAVFTPMGLFMRLLGRDPMQRRFDPAAKSHWVSRRGEKSTEDYFRQF
jgi:hypothetical protein